jgi:hypothetical protein
LRVRGIHVLNFLKMRLWHHERMACGKRKGIEKRHRPVVLRHDPCMDLARRYLAKDAVLVLYHARYLGREDINPPALGGV